MRLQELREKRQTIGPVGPAKRFSFPSVRELDAAQKANSWPIVADATGNYWNEFLIVSLNGDTSSFNSRQSNLKSSNLLAHLNDFNRFKKTFAEQRKRNGFFSILTISGESNANF